MRVSLGYILPLVEKEDTDLLFLLFLQVSTLQSILAAKTARIIIRGGKPALRRIEVEMPFVNSRIDTVARWHTGIN